MRDSDQQSLSATFRLSRPPNLAQTLAHYRMGAGDPCLRVVDGTVWRATRTPLGPATEHLTLLGDGSVRVEAWGPGAEWLIEHAPALCGALDTPEAFQPDAPLLRVLARTHPGLRIGRTVAVFETAMLVTLEQRVATREAWQSWRALVRALGEPAPGPFQDAMTASRRGGAAVPGVDGSAGFGLAAASRFGVDSPGAAGLDRAAAFGGEESVGLGSDGSGALGSDDSVGFGLDDSAGSGSDSSGALGPDGSAGFGWDDAAGRERDALAAARLDGSAEVGFDTWGAPGSASPSAASGSDGSGASDVGAPPAPDRGGLARHAPDRDGLAGPAPGGPAGAAWSGPSSPGRSGLTDPGPGAAAGAGPGAAAGAGPGSLATPGPGGLGVPERGGPEGPGRRRWIARPSAGPAPDPFVQPSSGLWVPPSAERIAHTPYEVFHRFGVERRRSEVLRRLAVVSRRLEEAAALPLEDAYRRLRAITGVGPWTAARTALIALGDPDAVPVGDLHIPHMVTWALAGERRGSDERMLELLEPFRGHRGRVIRLMMAGVRARSGPLAGERFRPSGPL